jgi:hypothetical protein
MPDKRSLRWRWRGGSNAARIWATMVVGEAAPARRQSLHVLRFANLVETIIVIYQRIAGLAQSLLSMERLRVLVKRQDLVGRRRSLS